MSSRLHTVFSIPLCTLLTTAVTVAGQDLSSLRGNYEFAKAAQAAEDAIGKADSLDMPRLEEELLLSQNGLNMMNYCCRPTVVSKHKFSINDYFLYYPFPDKSWKAIPNPLDSAFHSNPFVKALYAPQGSPDLYYSSEDSEGIRNIYRTSKGDSLWSAPKLINEHITSTSNEITPFVTHDGKHLYFASEGLYGMGGYDLYVSEWDESAGDWGIPSNLGFPFSSPYDDLLYMTTDDGKYSVFASNRECSRDSVVVYVLEFDSTPVRSAISDPSELRSLCSLAVDAAFSGGNLNTVSNPMRDDENTRLYAEKMAALRSAKEALNAENEALDALRAKLSSQEDADTKGLRADILQRELSIPALQQKVALASDELQKVELDFLMKGISIDPEENRAEAEREVVSGSAGYVFTKKTMGPALDIEIEEPEVVFDYSFRILDLAQFALDNTLPEGLVYQIKLFTLSRKAEAGTFKGLSPVFEKPSSSGRYSYSVGLFYAYNDVLSNLNKVKKLGFKDAVIAAYRDGKSLSISSARALEKKIRTLYKLRIYPPNGQSLPDNALEAIHNGSDKDIVRLMDGAAVVFEVGNFDGREQCDEIVSTLASLGISNVSVVEAGKILPEQ